MIITTKLITNKYKIDYTIEDECIDIHSIEVIGNRQLIDITADELDQQDNYKFWESRILLDIEKRKMKIIEEYEH